MDRFFIVGLLLLAQHICVASDSEDKPDITKGLTLPTGKIIPGYNDIREFKKDNTIMLLAERVKILCHFKNSYDSWTEEHRLYQKGCLESNEIALQHNATDEELKEIFGQTSDMLIGHTVTVATFLKKRVSDPDKQERLERVLGECRSWKTEDIQLSIMPQPAHDSVLFGELFKAINQLPPEVIDGLTSEKEKGKEEDQGDSPVISPFPSVLSSRCGDSIPISGLAAAKYYKGGDYYYQEFQYPIEEAEKHIPFNIIQVLAGAGQAQSLGRNVIQRDYAFSCLLDIYFDNNGSSIFQRGSGVVISPRIILTAAHNLYSVQLKRYPKKINCFVACYENSQEQKVKSKAKVSLELDPIQGGESIFLHPQYKPESISSDNYINFDIGLIIIDPKIHGEFKVPPARPYKLPEESLQSLIEAQDSFMMVGYPPMPDTMSYGAWVKRGQLVKKYYESRKIVYDVSTQQGFSGAGICFKKDSPNEHYACIGVHTFSTGEGVLIDGAIENKLKELSEKSKKSSEKL